MNAHQVRTLMKIKSAENVVTSALSVKGRQAFALSVRVLGLTRTGLQANAHVQMGSI